LFAELAVALHEWKAPDCLDADRTFETVTMIDRQKNVAVLGATGSIGRSALEVIGASEGRLQAIGLSANSSCQGLLEAAQQHRPRWIVVADRAAAADHDWSTLPSETQLKQGEEALVELVRAEAVDVVLAGIVGSAGLRSTWAAIEAGKTVALANKETLVMAGPLVMKLACERGVDVLPVDSEHSAVFQAVQAGQPDEVRRIVLTASGGPFRTHTKQQLEQVTVEEALRHPTWDMGAKITIDSATMMNKALEVIEARWLFGLPVEKIDVVVHPQSIVHSMVEFVDGSVIAQLSPPDMKLPIQYALCYPQRMPCIAERLDLTRSLQLDFEPPDFDRFPALRLGFEAAERGGTTGCVLNAANEAAVAALLRGKLPFSQLVPVCRSVLENHDFDPQPDLAEVTRLDRWAREEVARWISAC